MSRKPPAGSLPRKQSQIQIHTHKHTHAYLIDFMDLSSLPTGVLPGDSFLLLRKASRFFMSLALHKHAQKGKSWVLKVINKPTNQSKSWKTQRHKSKSDRQCSNPYKVPLPYMFSSIRSYQSWEDVFEFLDPFWETLSVSRQSLFLLASPMSEREDEWREGCATLHTLTLLFRCHRESRRL